MTANLEWQTKIGSGYVWSLSTDHGILAVLDPNSQTVHVLDTSTGEEIHSIQGSGTIDSLAVTSLGSILICEGVNFDTPGRIQATRLARSKNTEEMYSTPRILLHRTLEANRMEMDEVYLTRDWPLYHKKLSFGKIASSPNGEFIVYTGMSDRFDTKGFVVLTVGAEFERANQFTQQVAGIAEAPQDVAVSNNRAYVATGRGGSVEAIELGRTGGNLRRFSQPAAIPSSQLE